MIPIGSQSTKSKTGRAWNRNTAAHLLVCIKRRNASVWLNRRIKLQPEADETCALLELDDRIRRRDTLQLEVLPDLAKTKKRNVNKRTKKKIQEDNDLNFALADSLVLGDSFMIMNPEEQLGRPCRRSKDKRFIPTKKEKKKLSD